MKKYFVCVLILCFSISFSQNPKKISVHYKTKSLINIDALDEETKSNPMKIRYAKKLKKNYEDIEYILNIDGNSSIFNTVGKMNVSNEKNTIYDLQQSNSFYVDNTKYIEQIEFLGQNFLITEPSKIITWVLSNDTKEILGYKCLKAIYRNEGVENILIEAWYSPEIPHQFGPKGFHGLPGLILEIKQNDKLVYTASKINWDVKFFVIKPTKGKTISQSNFDNIVGNYSKEIKSYSKN